MTDVTPASGPDPDETRPDAGDADTELTATRTRMQGNGVGADELAAQRDPARVPNVDQHPDTPPRGGEGDIERP